LTDASRITCDEFYEGYTRYFDLTLKGGSSSAW
jgi:hypothetical protein